MSFVKSLSNRMQTGAPPARTAPQKNPHCP